VGHVFLAEVGIVGANVLFGLDGDMDMYIMMINDENICMLMNMFVWKQRRKKLRYSLRGSTRSYQQEKIFLNI
jgi:hypothetical protein